MDPIPAWTWRLWNAWDIRVLILWSLTLQIILVILGSRRRYIKGIWIEIMVWSAYLMADWVAAFAVGKLSSVSSEEHSNKENTNDPNTVLMSLWAPMLLVHLGGPDTISAYSIEDSQLWLRHLIGLLAQVVLTAYVILFCWSGSWLSILTLPMFIVGVIKYGERTWVLWYAKNEDQQGTESIEDHATALDLIRDIHGVKLLVVAYFWLQALTPYLANYGGKFSESGRVARISAEFEKREDIFDLIEFVLAFMYDVLYTKAAMIYNRVGFILRTTSFICLVTVLIGFSIVTKDGYSNVNVFITYILLGGAVALEFYSAALTIYSNWGILEMIKHSRNPLVTKLIRVLAPRALKRGQRWSGALTQFNLITFLLYEEKPKMLSRILKLFRMDETFRKYWCQSYTYDLTDLKLRIFEGVESINERIWESETFTQRGELALEKNQCLDKFEWSIKKDFDQSIIAWHIATDICYFLYDSESKDAHTISRRETSKLVSDYMMHLLVNHPHMLRIKGGNIMLVATCAHLKQIIFKNNGPFHVDKPDFWEMLLHNECDDDEPSVTQGWAAPRSPLALARYLVVDRLGELDNRWNILSSVWVEMLCHAASQCQVSYHAKQLTRGGELLTHVWLLLTIYGFTEKVNEASLTLRKNFRGKSIAEVRV